MQFSKVSLALSALATIASAQRPTNTSICDYYTTALLKNNTAANQATILTLLVNTVVIGNYTKPVIAGVNFPNISVPGILANGTVNGTAVNLAPYFTGALASSNRGGSQGVSVNFLDDGGAAPLMKNMASAGNTTSNQYMLLTHLYTFFGTLLGCSQQGMTGFQTYNASGGHASMYNVHKYMDLSYAEVTYFVTQVGLAAESFGVADSDVTIVGNALNEYFNVKCAPETEISPQFGDQLNSICIDSTCPTAPNATCAAYGTAFAPDFANGTNSTTGATSPAASSSASGTSGSTPSSTASSSAAGSSSTTKASAAGAVEIPALGFAGVLAAVFGLLL